MPVSNPVAFTSTDLEFSPRFDCAICPTRCDGKSKSEYVFEDDVAASEEAEDWLAGHLWMALDVDVYTAPARRHGLPDLALIGIRLFNQGEYYKCHDALEEAWRQETSPIRELYRSILQVGIAYFQIERGNYRGGMKMLLRVRQWLDPLPAHCRGVNIDQLRQDVDAVQRLLTQLGPDRIAGFDKTLFRPIDYEEGNKY